MGMGVARSRELRFQNGEVAIGPRVAEPRYVMICREYGSAKILG